MAQNKCGVFLISGFLGSGKTTLLRHLLENVPEEEKAAVLINEFGKAGVDGDVVRKKGLEIVEISRGSIFCACAKGDFLRGLHTIFRDYSPSVLFIEASGVADTTDMERDLGHTMLQNFYYLCGNICVVDAQCFEDWADLFNAVPKQVQAATAIILNKTDLAEEANLVEIEQHLKTLNPNAKITRAQYGGIPWVTIAQAIKQAQMAATLPGDEEWEQFIEAALCDIKGHLAPPDKLASQSVFWQGNADAFKQILTELPKDIVRAKGYFTDNDGSWQIFDIVGHTTPTYSQPDKDFEAECNLAVFIRTIHARREIPSLFEAKGLRMLEIRFG